MLTAKEVSRWFIISSHFENQAYGSELITPLKLQKLLYYAQGVNFAYNRTPLFNEDFLAWEHGPVIKDIYAIYNGREGIPYNPQEEDAEILSKIESDPNIQRVLDAVYEKYGMYTASYLRNKTHSESPWKTTPANEIITKEKIRSYFQKTIR